MVWALFFGEELSRGVGREEGEEGRKEEAQGAFKPELKLQLPLLSE